MTWGYTSRSRTPAMIRTDRDAYGDAGQAFGHCLAHFEAGRIAVRCFVRGSVSDADVP